MTVKTEARPALVDGGKTVAYRWDLRNCENPEMLRVEIDADGNKQVIAPPGAEKRVFLEQTLEEGQEVERIIYNADGEKVFEWHKGEKFDIAAQNQVADPALWGHVRGGV